MRLFPAILLLALAAHSAEFTNSLNMRMVHIPSGVFTMGETATLADALLDPLTYPRRSEMQSRHPNAQFVLPFEAARHGDFDERPAHRVRITKPFSISAHEVTNAQYEQYDPAHRALRGKHGFSKEDNEAVVFVSHADAVAFCQWLSKKEGRSYRLPTEAEWEYAARAGTTTPFATGATLPPAFLKNARSTEFNSPTDIVPLTTGQTPANPWGLHDMHGNVEEWTADWYGPYTPNEQTDPTGRATGDFRVTRGGSHGTDPYYLRSANRSGSLPETRHWLIGFRVVQGEAPQTKPLPVAKPSPLKPQQNEPKISGPYFRGPLPYVNIPPDSHGPLYSWHNHDTAIAECPNGDILAIWYTCEQERGRELAVASARLRKGAAAWDPAQPFWDAPDRNDHCPALWFDGKETLYHFNGLGVAGRWEPLAIVMRTSKDNGQTWSPPRLIAADFGYRNMLGQPVFRTADGAIAIGADAAGGSTIWVTRDEGATWADAGGNIRGIHAGITQMKDGRLLAIARGQNIDGFSPKSISADMGKTWQYESSGIPPLGGGQRLVLMRLREGPLFLASFSDNITNFAPKSNRSKTSLFAALSFDEGQTWPIRRIITDGREHAVETIDGGKIRMSPTTSEPQGYLSATQARNGVIHLISSYQHYAFNIEWLKQPPPPPTPITIQNLQQQPTLELEGPGKLLLSIRTGPLTANRYQLTTAAKQTKIIIRDDTIAQVYADNEPIQILEPEIIIDWREPARGTYYEWSGPMPPKRY